MRSLFRFFFRISNPLTSVQLSSHHCEVQHSSSFLTIRPSDGCLYIPSNALPLHSFNPSLRCFSSAQISTGLERPKHLIVVDIFSNTSSDEEIKKQLEMINFTINPDSALKALQECNTNPELAGKIFNWVSANEGKLNSETYNAMLDILLSSGSFNKFWDLVKVMKRKGYAVSNTVYTRASEKFEDGQLIFLERLKGFNNSGSNMDGSTGSLCSKICELIKTEMGGDNFEKQLQGMNITFSSALMREVIEKLVMNPIKAFLFFKWIEESGLFHHDARSYNVIASILTRGDCIEMLLNVMEKMMRMEYELEAGTYVTISAFFRKKKLVKEAIDLYEYAMKGSRKPSEKGFTLLLKKIVVGKKLDMDLFSRAVSIYVQNGNTLRSSMFNGVRKSLSSVGRLGECSNILKVMKNNGLAADTSLLKKVTCKLSESGKGVERDEFLNVVEEIGCGIEQQTLISSVERYSAGGNLDKAKECVKRLLLSDKNASSHALDLLVLACCNKGMESEAYQSFNELSKEEGLKPAHSTFKRLVKKLLAHGLFEDALNILGSMKNHGFPPYTDPFIDYLSNSGTCEEAVTFFKAASGKRVRSSSIFLRTFKAYLSAAKQSEAQDLLSKCPGFVRTNADILNLFCSFSSKNGESSSLTAAA